jgi:hypothetical protein
MSLARAARGGEAGRTQHDHDITGESYERENDRSERDHGGSCQRCSAEGRRVQGEALRRTAVQIDGNTSLNSTSVLPRASMWRARDYGDIEQQPHGPYQRSLCSAPACCPTRAPHRPWPCSPGRTGPGSTTTPSMPQPWHAEKTVPKRQGLRDRRWGRPGNPQVDDRPTPGQSQEVVLDATSLGCAIESRTGQAMMPLRLDKRVLSL